METPAPLKINFFSDSIIYCLCESSSILLQIIREFSAAILHYETGMFHRVDFFEELMFGVQFFKKFPHFACPDYYGDVTPGPEIEMSFYGFDNEGFGGKRKRRVIVEIVVSAVFSEPQRRNRG